MRMLIHTINGELINMKKYQVCLSVFLMQFTINSWAFFGLFYSDSDKIADLQQAALWLIESGVDVYAKEGKTSVESLLLKNVSPALKRELTLDIESNLIGNKDEIAGGGIGMLYIEGTPDRYEAIAGVLYRTEIDGETYEYWRVKVHTDRNFGKDRYDLLFVLAKVVKGSERRVILHKKDHFFENFEITPSRVFSLPLNNVKLVKRLQPGRVSYRHYFKDTPLENKRYGQISDKQWGIVTYDAASASLKKRKKSLKKLSAIAWWLPKEGIPVYENGGVSDLKEKLKATYLDLDIQVEEDNYKDGAGKVFVMKEESALFNVYLVSRTELAGDVYEYWYLEGQELGESNPLKHDTYVVAKVGSQSKYRETLKKSNKPFVSYTVQSGSVIHLPEVNSVIGKNND